MIRPLEAGDRVAWEDLWRGYQRFYRVDFAAGVTQETFRRLLDPAEPMGCALAAAEGRPVGLVHFIFHRSTWTVGNYCYLQDLFIADEARGKGLGRALIGHVCDRAAKEGASRVHWLTHETNHDAMALYDTVAERSGFLQYRRILG